MHWDSYVWQISISKTSVLAAMDLNGECKKKKHNKTEQKTPKKQADPQMHNIARYFSFRCNSGCSFCTFEGM